jgi:nanoRNase/pAp phosphatase (c-di-AMP/oligoRNAs hydrolase)
MACVKVVNGLEIAEAYGSTSVAIVILTEDTSRILHRVLEKFPNADVAVGVNPRDNSISLRSRPDGPSVARIAEKLGGGGHASAAGYVSKVKLIDAVVEIL